MLFDLLRTCEANFSVAKSKVHLARFNQHEHPLDVFLEGNFDEWQNWQRNRNFGREYVVSLVQANSPTRWLFVGLFQVHGCEERVEDAQPHYVYNMTRVEAAEEFVGRLYLASEYKQRNSYPRGETLADDLLISELLRERLSISLFPGYKNVQLTKRQLDIVVRQNVESWKAALSSVKGIYLITDAKTGKLYVGKADGEEGIWGRWCIYAATTHGHNVALKREFGIEAGPDRAADLRFSILEIADLHTMKDDIAKRENHWKEILMTRPFGYNRN